MDREEKVNSLTHLIGAVAVGIGLALLVRAGVEDGDPWKILSFSVYGTALLLLYIISTLYHLVRGAAKRVFRKLDHVSIYLLIAGTYTPFALVTLRGTWGWTLFSLNWLLATVGIVLDGCRRSGPRILPVVLYLAMGWLALVALPPLVRALSPAALAYLFGGGVSYTAGLVFYAVDTRIAYGHGIWHLFVLGGSVSHYLAVFLYVA